jgi:hypothetical protein
MGSCRARAGAGGEGLAGEEAPGGVAQQLVDVVVARAAVLQARDDAPQEMAWLPGLRERGEVLRARDRLAAPSPDGVV